MMIKDNTKYPGLQTIIDNISDDDEDHDTGWWGSQYGLPLNRGIKSRLINLEKSGFLRSYTKSMSGGRGYLRYWTLTDKGAVAAELGLKHFRTTGELYVLLFRNCFHPISLRFRDDYSGDFELTCGWSRRRALKHVV
jgi:hypothetical protein